MDQTLVGVFDGPTHAQMARDELIEAGFSQSCVRLQQDSSTGTAGGTGMTGTTGTVGTAGTTGMSSSAAATSTSGAQNDWNTGTSGHEQSGGIGGFFRSLFGFDDNDEDVSMYSEAARRGSYILSVDVEDDAELERAHEILQRHGPIDIDEQAAQWRNEGWSGGATSGSAMALQAGSLQSGELDETSPNVASQAARSMTADSDTTRIPVVQEELQVGKRTVRAGGLRVFTRLHETPVEQQVQLREERAHVERRAVDRPATEADFNQLRDGTIEVRESSEEAVVGKRARVVEEVEVGKDVRERTETVRDTVRRTEVEVEQLGEHATASAAGGALSPTSDRSTTDLDSDRPMASDSTTRTGRDEDLSTKAARTTDKVENAIERGVDKVTGRSTTKKR